MNVQPDRLIHERMRLGIVGALAANEHLTFLELKKLLNTTDGNVSVHARKLEEAGYISCTKLFDGRVPRTEYRLTAAGRQALEKIPESHGGADTRNAWSYMNRRDFFRTGAGGALLMAAAQAADTKPKILELVRLRLRNTQDNMAQRTQ